MVGSKNKVSVTRDSIYLSESLAERFLAHAVQISLFGAQIGIEITPTLDPKLLIFRALPIEQQMAVVQKIEQNCEIFSSIVREKQDLRSSFSVVWKSLNWLGLRPPPHRTFLTS